MFSSAFPFQQLQEVVVGRFLVDGEILRLAFAQSLPVVDVSAFISVHQGSNSSFSHAHALDPKDLYYNKQFQAPFQNGALKCTLHAESSVCNKHFIWMSPTNTPLDSLQQTLHLKRLFIAS